MFPSSKRIPITVLLMLSLWMQVITPPVMAAPVGPSPISLTFGKASRNVLATLAVVQESLVTFLRATFTPQEQWNVVLTPASAEFKDYAGVDYHASSRKLLLAANTPGGQPNNFETVAADGSRSAFSNVNRPSTGG